MLKTDIFLKKEVVLWIIWYGAYVRFEAYPGIGVLNIKLECQEKGN
jgi:hypothetical protein